MLMNIRDKIIGPFAWIIVAMISVPFVLWGIQNYSSSGGESVAASVGEVDITAQQLEQEYARQRQQMLQMFGQQLPADFFERMGLKKQVLDRLINAEVLQQQAEKQGYYVSDALLAKIISHFEAFNKDGKFDMAAYESALYSQGMSVAQFEAKLRRSYRLSQMQNGISASGFITTEDVNQRLLMDGQKREVSYIKLPFDAYEKQVSVSDDEIQQYYNENSSQFEQGARVKVSYVELSADALVAGIQVSDDVLHEQYQQQIDKFRGQELRKASHILLKLDENADELTTQAVQARLQEIQGRLAKGEDFAKLAQEVSEDPGSAVKGGDLGEVRRGVMVKPFEDALFALGKGEISAPVRSQFGYHLIKLEGITQQPDKTFDEVKAQLAKEYRQKEAENQYYEKAEQLANLAYESRDSFDTIEQQLGLKAKQSEWFEQGAGSGIAANEVVRKAAFAPDVLETRTNSEVLELGPNHVAVIRISDHEDARLKSLDEVLPEVREQLVASKTRSLMSGEADKLAAEVEKGGNVDALAKAAHGEVVKAGLIDMNAVNVMQAVKRQAFRLPVDKLPAAASVQLAGDSVAVVVVWQVQDANLADVKLEDRVRIEHEMESTVADTEFAAYLQALRDSTSITMSKDL